MIRLLEITRNDLVTKTRVQSPDRFNKRLNYKPLSYRDINLVDLFEDDFFSVRVPVGKYICTIGFSGVFSEIKRILKQQTKPNFTLQTVIRALSRAFDHDDIVVDCTCPDFKYRIDYWASKHGYKFGKQQTIPSRITNPDDKKGAVCKHLMSLLSNKNWITKLASVLNQYLREYSDELLDIIDTDPDIDVMVNPRGRPKYSKSIED